MYILPNIWATVSLDVALDSDSQPWRVLSHLWTHQQHEESDRVWEGDSGRRMLHRGECLTLSHA